MLKVNRSLLIIIVAVGLAGSLLALRKWSKQLRGSWHLDRADKYYAASQFDPAEIEYLNAARLLRNNPHVTLRLGLIYFTEGLPQRAYAYLSRAEQLLPDDLEVRLDLGLYQLALGKTDAARDEALAILDRKPDSDDAPLLLAESASQPHDLDAAWNRLEQLPPSIRSGTPVLVALGNLQLRQKHYTEAQELFEQAVKTSPKFANAWTGMAALAWHNKDVVKADEYFGKAAELSPIRSSKRLQYAQFKIQTGNAAAGRKILEDIVRQAPDFLPPNMQLAELDEKEGKFDDGEARVTKVMGRDLLYPDALFLSGRLKLAKNQPAQAATIFDYAQSLFPRNPMLGYELAQAYLGTGQIEKALSELNATVTWAPNFAEAVVALAQLQIRQGDIDSAIINLKQIVARRPDYAPASVLLANSYLSQGHEDDALTLFRQMAAAAPKDPYPLTLIGAALLQQGKSTEARASLDEAHRLDPKYLGAIEQLVSLDLLEKKFADARALVEAQIAAAPNQASGYLMLAKIFLSEGDLAQGETALKKTIDLQPDSTDAYFLLAEIYYKTKQDKQALEDLQKVATKDPKNTRATMLMGTIQLQENDFAAARATYERTLKADPAFSPALNNLAFLYTEKFGEFDLAIDMAQRARKLQPEEPETADTLGWALYHKRQYSWALSLLEEAAANLPQDGEVHYHLGMTQYMLGQDDAARLTFQRALQVGQDFPHAGDVRQRLALLATGVAADNAETVATLEQEAAKHQDDPIVLGRLAALYERNGATDKAIATSEAILQLNPNDVSALTRLARLYEVHDKLAKALEAAKTAHNLAPQDPSVSHVLGRLAYRSGNYAWSASLLGDAATDQPHDPEVLFDLGEAQYSLGRVAEAVDSMRRSLAEKSDFKHEAAAQQFLHFAVLADQPDKAVAATQDADRILATEPNYVPALIAKGLAFESAGTWEKAIRAYEAALNQFPSFTPAEKRLVSLYARYHLSAAPGDVEVATKAREAYPDDLVVAKACGIIAYRNGDYLRAESLLNETRRQVDDDGEAVFYIGMCQVHLNDKAAKDTLGRALELKLSQDLAEQAKRTLAGLKS